MEVRCPFHEGCETDLEWQITRVSNTISTKPYKMGMLPLFNTALHSSSDLESGCDIFCEAEVDVPKKEPRKGIDGIDFRTKARWIGAMLELPRGSGWSRAVALLIA